MSSNIIYIESLHFLLCHYTLNKIVNSHLIGFENQTLAEKLGRKNYILERASIDELFIDVTKFCYQKMAADCDSDKNGAINTDESEMDAASKFRSQCDTNDAVFQSMKETVICHEAHLDPREKMNDTATSTGRALRVGCHIARTVRRAVLDELGFTLSAGISTNKLVSKLAASYGKPNGQVGITI